MVAQRQCWIGRNEYRVFKAFTVFDCDAWLSRIICQYEERSRVWPTRKWFGLWYQHRVTVRPYIPFLDSIQKQIPDEATAQTQPRSSYVIQQLHSISLSAESKGFFKIRNTTTALLRKIPFTILLPFL